MNNKTIVDRVRSDKNHLRPLIFGNILDKTYFFKCYAAQNTNDNKRVLPGAYFFGSTIKVNKILTFGIRNFEHICQDIGLLRSYVNKILHFFALRAKYIFEYLFEQRTKRNTVILFYKKISTEFFISSSTIRILVSFEVLS